MKNWLLWNDIKYNSRGKMCLQFLLSSNTQAKEDDLW